MRARLFMFLIIFSLSSHVAGSEMLKFWNVTSESTLKINGTTNVNSFECLTDYDRGMDLIMERWDPYHKKWEIYGSVNIGVDQFDCKNRVMNNDFRNTLKYETYPEIKIEFINIREVETDQNTRTAEGWVEITIVGETRRYFLSGELELIKDYKSILRGEQKFRFTDFGIDPPTKGLGLIRVRDEISVNFELILEQTAYSGN